LAFALKFLTRLFAKGQIFGFDLLLWQFIKEY
jgi:hypothetical protein